MGHYLIKTYLFIFTLSIFSADVTGQYNFYELAPLPEAISNNAVCGAIVNNQKYVYTFGGIDTSKVHSGIHNRCYKYDVQNDSWSTLPDLPSSPTRIASAASTINDIIYIIGGYHVFPNGHEESHPLVHRFDTKADTFLTNGAPLPKSTDDHVQAVYKDSLIFVVTGWSNTANIANVQIYNPQLDTWLIGTPVPNNHLYKSFGASGEIIGDTIYYFGGAKMGNNFPIQIQVRKGYINPNNVTQITWSLDTIDQDLEGYRMAVSSYNNSIRWIGGSNHTYNYNGIGYAGNIPVEPNRRILTYYPHSDSWDTTSFHSINMDFRGIATFGCDMILVGGIDSSQTVSTRTLHLECLSNSIPKTDASKTQGSLYPNPSDQYFKLRDLSPHLQISIYNMDGQIQFNGVISPNENIRVSHLPSGLYIVAITSEENTHIEKLIIQHKKSD
ncbi:T9SS type A sorting domain-containing protein [bacterium SCSIO 12643]|nr:T9SS type A sorting domain-containing protein [bacterium SCSIO 12643]